MLEKQVSALYTELSKKNEGSPMAKLAVSRQEQDKEEHINTSLSSANQNYNYVERYYEI